MSVEFIPLTSSAPTPHPGQAVLRALQTLGGWRTRQEIAERSQLSRDRVWDSLKTLLTAQLIERMGQGKATRYRACPVHPDDPA